MRINLPVTDKEIILDSGTILVTRTDLNGVITYANDAFIKISGYSREELIGSPHNVVRHPDMPSEAYEDMWATLKQNRPWHGVVKNRTKNGDYYWVDANAMPLFKDRKPYEYLSVRHVPKRKKIEEADKFYKAVNNKQASFKLTFFAKVIKLVKELAIWKKISVASLLFLFPSIPSVYDAIAHENYLFLGEFLTSVSIGAWLVFKIASSIDCMMEVSVIQMYRMSDGHFGSPAYLDRNDQIGDFFRAIYATEVKLGVDLAQTHQANEEAQRIVEGLESVKSSVVIANTELDIIFINASARKLFESTANDIRKQLPHFDPKKLLKSNVSQFHKKPEYVLNLLKNAKDPINTELTIGGCIFGLSTAPVKNIKGDCIGYVTEWVDRTSEIRIEEDVNTLVSAIHKGDLSKRITLDNKQGFIKTLSVGINELTDVIEEVFNDINHVMENMANGDLSNTINKDYQGVYAECKENINHAIEKVSELILKANDAARFIESSSQEMASGNNNLSNRVEQQASNVEKTAMSMQTFAETVKSNAEHTKEASNVVNETIRLATKGDEVVKAAIEAMQEINESSNKIAEVISVIDEIAFQTNLLALNASVEAARAGEQGRGFSVVATEVRNLAQRSAKAAQESGELIQNSVQKVRVGTNFVNETGKSLAEIAEGITKVGDIVERITLASVEQSTSINSVNQAVAQIDDITQQNAALAEQAAAASMGMTEQSTNLRKLLGFFNAGSKAKNVSTNSVRNVQVAVAKPVTQKAVVNVNSPKIDDEWEEF